MTDKITKKRVKVDYKGLIKGSGLWFAFKKFKKSKPRKTKSDRKLMYCFCLKYLRSQLSDVINFQLDLDECIRIAKTPWLDEE